MRHGLLWTSLVCLAAPVARAQEHHHEQPHSHRGPGPHFIDAFFTENAYVERKLRPDVFYGAGNGADLYTFQLEVEWALHRDWSLIVHAPVHDFNRFAEGAEAGVGDVSVGAKWAAINNRRAFILAIGADAELPTGDETRGLGHSHAAAAPFALAWLPFGPERRALLQTAAHVDIPLEASHGAHAEVSAALSYTTAAGVTPIVELSAEFPVEGGERTTWQVAPEFRWEFAQSWEVGAAVRLPAGGPREEDYRMTFGFIKHYPVPM
jgi:hypothetical protein